MLQRILEPEVMDTVEEALDYDSMDHAQVNQRFVDDFLQRPTIPQCDSAPNRTISLFDAGTGTAQIPILLVAKQPLLRIVAADLAREMLKVAQRNLERAGLTQKIELAFADCKALEFPANSFDGVISNSIIHHIPDPECTLRELWRILKPGGVLFVRDLLRPETSEQLELLVKTYAGDANRHQQQLFRQSLHAALTVNEVCELCKQAGVILHPSPEHSVAATSDRHWTLFSQKPSFAQL